MTPFSRREFLAGLALTGPAFRRTRRQPPRQFAWVNELPAEQFPAGVRHATFYSPSNQTAVGYCVFLPPGYDSPQHVTRRYPVIYHLHGGFVGSELIAIRLAEPLGAAMRDGHVTPAIYVFPNGGKVSHYDYPALDTYGETALVKELVPHVDKTYRTIAHRDARGLEGFSACGRGTARMMFKHPELFNSAVPMSGGHQHEKYIHDNKGPSRVPPDLIFEPTNNTYDLARRYAGQRTHRVNILVVVGTEDSNYEGNLEWMKHLDTLGIKHDKLVVDGVGHNLPRLLERIGPQIWQFHATLVRGRQNADVGIVAVH